MANANENLDFLIIGAGKSGTTSLADFVSHHPDVLMTQPKEPWFFDTNDYHRGMTWYWQEYLGHYAGEKCVGEASSQTLFVPYAARRLKSAVPNARLIAILRNPIDRAHSDWWMKRCQNWETADFDTAIRENLSQLARDVDFSDPVIWQRHIDSHKHEMLYRTYIEYGYYATQLERYLACFPRDQMLIILSDDFSRNVKQTLERVWRFLEVNPSSINEGLSKLAPKNVARSPLGVALARTSATTPVVSKIRQLLPEGTKNVAISLLRKLDPGKRPQMSRDIRRMLSRHYQDEMRRLGTIVGRDLSSWAQLD